MFKSNYKMVSISSKIVPATIKNISTLRIIYSDDDSIYKKSFICLFGRKVPILTRTRKLMGKASNTLHWFGL